MRGMEIWLGAMAFGLAAMVAAQPPTQAERAAAAQATAERAEACRAARPFYWEIGDGGGALASGAVGAGAPGRQTRLALASASKWIYAAYVAQRRQGRLSESDIRLLSFRSAYTGLRGCGAWQTVASCMNSRINDYGRPDAAGDGRFFYNGGHMQRHALEMGLGEDGNEALAVEVRNGLSVMGADWGFGYAQPQPAGGGVGSAGDYARFLQAIIAGRLAIHALLGAHAVCANPRACPRQALQSPIPENEVWHYSIGHWVEDDPGSGDGAFSSPGAFGFYPWISRDKAHYGVLAREAHAGWLSRSATDKPYLQSAVCGRALRQAWSSGQAVR
ncbi:hypothetical protein [Chromobacterium aquaticum]|uniref:Beta-lactamase-related domain-containing protein n=2 Tax=Chromobacterium aquaticum TaxID=467180 RepID=A0ABV8ZKR4_9NEIS